MRKRRFSLAMTAAIVAAACGSSATPAPTRAPTAAPASAAATAAPTQVPLPDLTKTNYKPEPVGKRGGKLVLGIGGEPNTIWYQRCWLREQLGNPERCAAEEPAARDMGNGHQVACHFAEQVSRSVAAETIQGVIAPRAQEPSPVVAEA